MTSEEIRALLNDIESDTVERTISTTNTDKFHEAIANLKRVCEWLEVLRERYGKPIIINSGNRRKVAFIQA